MKKVKLMLDGDTLDRIILSELESSYSINLKEIARLEKLKEEGTIRTPQLDDLKYDNRLKYALEVVIDYYGGKPIDE